MISVLLVDDDSDLPEMIELLLEMNGMSSRYINNGIALFTALDIAIPDIILMDVFLGDTDGRELCFNLKGSNKYKNIPVVLYSAGILSSSSIDGSKADAFLRKPFDNDELIEKLKVLALAGHN